MSYLNNQNQQIDFLDMDGTGINIGDHIYPPAGGQELRVAWFQPDFPELGDVLMCQQVAHLDTFSPLTVENCAQSWKCKPSE